MPWNLRAQEKRSTTSHSPELFGCYFRASKVSNRKLRPTSFQTWLDLSKEDIGCSKDRGKHPLSEYTAIRLPALS